MPQNVVAVNLGNDFSAAITQSGDLYTWGKNSNGQLGLGDTINRSTPQKVGKIPAVAKVELGSSTCSAVTQDSRLFTWGSPGVGELGLGEIYDNVTEPRQVDLANVVDVSMGHQITAAVTSDGSVYTWGWNAYGELGLGSAYQEFNYRTPIKLTALSGVASVSVGGDNSVALKKDGSVYAWGNNSYAQLGLGDFIARTTPVKVELPQGIVAVSMSTSHCAAVSEDGSLYTCGKGGFTPQASDWSIYHKVYIQDYSEPSDPHDNSRYTVKFNANGHGTAPASIVNIPVGSKVQAPLAPTAAGFTFGGWYKEAACTNAWDFAVDTVNSNITLYAKWINKNKYADTFSMGCFHSAAIASDGSLYTWGDNRFGQLGHGNTIELHTPQKVENLTNVVAVSLGYGHSAAITSDGSLYTWGCNDYGQLGHGDTANRYTPQRVEKLTNVIAVSL